jgi:hypothetical protein
MDGIAAYTYFPSQRMPFDKTAFSHRISTPSITPRCSRQPRLTAEELSRMCQKRLIENQMEEAIHVLLC